MKSVNVLIDYELEADVYKILISDDYVNFGLVLLCISMINNPLTYIDFLISHISHERYDRYVSSS